jgi:uncharacterized membrane protein YeaQ/YmgE (transglycosylase-associated protein family)
MLPQVAAARLRFPDPRAGSCPGIAWPRRRARCRAMGILSWIVFGLVAGVIAKVIMPGKDPGGWIITILLGIGGSFVGGYLATYFKIATGTGFNLRSLGAAVVGAMVILLAYRLIRR